jgi:hypothetical protein
VVAVYRSGLGFSGFLFFFLVAFALFFRGLFDGGGNEEDEEDASEERVWTKVCLLQQTNDLWKEEGRFLLFAFVVSWFLSWFSMLAKHLALLS